MNNNLFTNQYSFNLTGTNFGLLDQYNKTKYINSYFFSDIYGNTNFTFPVTTYGGKFFKKYTNQEILNLSNLLFWIDSSDTSTLGLSTNSQISKVLSIKDKTPNQYVFKTYETKNTVTTAYWPVDKNYSLLTQEYINTNYIYLSGLNKALNLGTDNYLSCSSVKINMFQPYTFYFVWKNNFVVGESIERSIPFSFITDVNGVSSELLPFFSRNSTPNIILGTRDSLLGVEVYTLSSYNIDISRPYIIEYTHDGTFINNLSSQSISINSLSISGSDVYFVPNIFEKDYTTTIGYSGDSNTNDFYFCEMIGFNRILSQGERINLLNTLFDKWRINSVKDNTTYSKGVVSGGLLQNTSYEDFSLLTSNFNLPVQSCVTQLTISLSSFDESVSKIKSVLYNYKDLSGELNTTVTNINTSVTTKLNDRYVTLLLKPSTKKYFDNFVVSLSVIKYDGTLNKINVTGNITQCSIRDLHDDNYLVDSQILDDINQNMLVFENKNKKQLFLNKIDTQVQAIHLSGGDVVELVNNEVEDSTEKIITLAEIFEEEVISKPVYKVPFLRPPVFSESNPVKPL